MSTHPTPAFDPQSTTLATRAFTVQLSCALDDLAGLPAATAVHRIIPRLVLRGEIERVSAAKYLLLALLGLCDPETGTTTEGLSTADLACRFGLSQDTVKRVLLDLRRLGLVASTPARGAGRGTRRSLHHIALFDVVDACIAAQGASTAHDAPQPSASSPHIVSSNPTATPARVQNPADAHETRSDGSGRVRRGTLSQDDADKSYADFCVEAGRVTGLVPLLFMDSHPSFVSDTWWFGYNNCWAQYFRALGRPQPGRLAFLAEMGWPDEASSGAHADDSSSTPNGAAADAGAGVLIDALSSYTDEDFDDGADAARELSRREAPPPSDAEAAIAAMSDVASDDPSEIDLVMRVGALDPGRG